MSRGFGQQYGPWGLVAGGALGLGEAWCDELAARGLNIVSIDRDSDALAAQDVRLRESFGVEVRRIEADLTDPDILEIVRDRTADLEIGIMVFSAAMETDPTIVHPHLFHEGSLAFHRDLIRINVTAVCEFAYHFGGRMKERGRGGLVLISSGADGQGAPFVANYGASKAYDTVLGEALWFELKPYNVDVIAAPLGMTRTTALADFPDVPAMPADETVREILAALGRRPQIVPGRKNRFFQWILKRLVPRRRAIRMFADIHLDNFLKGNGSYDVYRR